MPIDLAPVQSLAAAVSAACAEIDAEAERVRLTHITGGAGQALAYQAKSAEARAILADDQPDPAAYPMVSARAEVAGITLQAAAQQIAARAAEWQQLGAAIEHGREAGKHTVRTAHTHAQVGRSLSAALSGLAALAAAG